MATPKTIVDVTSLLSVQNLAEEQEDKREQRCGDKHPGRGPPGEGCPRQHAQEEAGRVADHGHHAGGPPDVRVRDLTHKYRA